ncbi:F0F1 ATP synthase subunit A [Crossiella equi]|nr:F0F1 ATP synthase subunit A [Crossiella equi]
MLLAATGTGDEYQPPTVEHAFFFDKIGDGFWITSVKAMTLLGIGAVIVIAFMLWTSRNAKVVPSKIQFMGESLYGFVRNNIAVDIMGKKDGLKWAPFLASLFIFILVLNLFGIVPLAQYPVTSHLAIPAVLSGLVYIIYNVVGIRKHGFGGYFKMMTIPPGVPVAVLPLVALIEFASNFIFRPFTLAVRLFANTFAGHLILTIFGTATLYLIERASVMSLIAPLSGAMLIIMTFFELLVACLQAYVFTVLAAFYIQSALADEH